MKIKVLHLSKMKGVSGSENHLLTLLTNLDQRRFEVHLWILAETAHVPLLQSYKQTLEQAGVAVVIFIMPHRHWAPSLLSRLKTYLIQEKIQLVHTHLIHADFYGMLAAKWAGVPAIISSRHNDDQFRRNIFLIWLNRLLAHWQTRLIVISDWVGIFLQEVERIPAAKIVRIHYGLATAPLLAEADPHYLRQQFAIPADAPVIGTIGRLTAQKGHVYLLQAVKQVIAEFPALRVFLIGDGELRAELEAQAQQLGISANMVFTGYRNDARKLLAGFDVFVFPSLWEGFGLVLLEAMALQKAIIASQVSAIPESVQHGQTGILVPPKQPAELAQAMLTLLRNVKLARTMGEAGYAYLQQHFTVTKMVQRTEMVYQEALGVGM